MKKRLLILLAALLCLVCALALTACEEEPEAPAPDAPAHTHAWGEWVETTAPTCTTKGIKTRACACGQSATQYVDIDPNAHAPATAWTTDGTHHWKVCTRMGCTVQLSKTTHSYGDWVVTLAPTCVAEGSHYRDCTICAYRQTEAIPIDASKHAPATTWEKDATGHWHKCTRTGCTAQLSKTTHSYGDWVEALAPTCVAEGSHYKTCQTCSHKVTEAIPIDTSKHAPAADWTTDGTLHWKICTRTGCGAAVNKTTHSYGAWTETLAPTCVAEGSHYKTCTTCSHKVTEAIPIDASKHVPATTWEKDAIGHRGICSNSGCNYMYEKVPHTYNTQNICTVCAHAYVEIGLKFTLSGGTYTVTDYTGTATEVIIPATYKGVAVTGIGDYAFRGCSNLTSVTIPAGVTSIGEDAFYGCSNLTTVEFGANSQLTSIGNYAFSGCSKLTSVTILAGVTSIGAAAFEDCSQLTAVYITDLAAWCNIKFSNYVSNPLYYAKNLYLNGQLITALEIPSGVTAVRDYAFSDCSNLTSVTIPAGVTSIGSSAFEDCSQLTSVTIPAGVTSIGFSAFSGCDSLTSVTIPASVTSISSYAFEGCSGLTSITVASGNTKYHSAGNCLIETATGTLVLGCKNSVIPADGSVTSIGYRAFSGCSGMTSITIPASVTSIGNYAFFSCSNLTTVEFGANSQLTSIGSSAFYFCSQLTSVTISASVTSIGDDAFRYCSKLTSVTFANPNGWWYAFSVTAASGTAIPAADLSNASTAATYLTSTYYDYYWKRT